MKERRPVKVSFVATPSEYALLVALTREEGRTRSQVIQRLIVAEGRRRGYTEEASDG